VAVQDCMDRDWVFETLRPMGKDVITQPAPRLRRFAGGNQVNSPRCKDWMVGLPGTERGSVGIAVERVFQRGQGLLVCRRNLRDEALRASQVARFAHQFQLAA
jgi:hypothetical protein